MRWVNHYTHPGDTRYHVFVFREAHYVSRFESRCQEEGIPYEKHEEGEEVMFGIAKKSGKITPLRAPRTTTPKFSAVYSSDKQSDDYGKYCRFSLVKYRPWAEKPFCGEEPSEVESIKQWEEYVKSASFRERRRRFPDVIVSADEVKRGEALQEDLVHGDEVQIDSNGRMMIEI